MKSTLCLDFDGVLHSYTTPWGGAGTISDPPVPGAMKFLEAAVEKFEVAVYSSRSGNSEGNCAMRVWLRDHLVSELGVNAGRAVYEKVVWPVMKPTAFVTLDDRAITFTGTWPDLDELAAFRPWNKT